MIRLTLCISASCALFVPRATIGWINLQGPLTLKSNTRVNRVDCSSMGSIRQLSFEPFVGPEVNSHVNSLFCFKTVHLAPNTSGRPR